MTRIQRETFTTSRSLDFCTEEELGRQTGHTRQNWPLVILKELIDNSLDACEESGIAPLIDVVLDADGITVRDNGPGIPESTIEGIRDFNVQVSSREAYKAPDRGAQGNAWKTILAIPYVLDGREGKVSISTGGTEYLLTFRSNIRKEADVGMEKRPSEVKKGQKSKSYSQIHLGQFPARTCDFYLPFATTLF